MIISTNIERITLKNILVGDVYIVSGQSNMEFLLKDSLNYINVSNDIENQNIRYCKMSSDNGENTISNYPWQLCDKHSCDMFSAVAYYFAKNIQENTRVPVGIIECSKGGTSAACWISDTYLKKDKEVSKIYFDTYNEIIKNLSEEQEEENNRDYNNQLKKYTTKLEKYKTRYPNKDISEIKKMVGHTPWPPPLGRKSFNRPSGMYESFITKLSNTKVKGVLWYQGEEDVNRSYLYEKLLSLLITNWRQTLSEDTLPFIIIQLPSYNDDKIDHNWPEVRQAQLNVSKKVKNVRLVVTIDCGEEYNIHPIDKERIGYRAALITRAWLYDESIICTCPHYSHFKNDDNKIEIYMQNVENGLKIKGSRIKSLEVSYDGKEYFIPDAYIDKDVIVILNNRSREYKYIRYSWQNYSCGNIFNNNDFPLIPFKLCLDNV